jgi:hypothetical protein
MPSSVKKLLPPWQISAGLVTLIAFYTKDEFLTTITILFWASITFTWGLTKLKSYKKRLGWLVPLYHAGLFVLVAAPAFAAPGDAACTNSGIFAQLTNFVNQLFSNISFGTVGGGTLGALICQVIGFLTILLILGFTGAAGTMSYKIAIQGQPISTTLEPLMGFLIFSGFVTMVIGVMLGTSTQTV